MALIRTGWTPPNRVRRAVVLPMDLDQRVTMLATRNASTPSSVVADALKEAVAVSCPEGEVVHAMTSSFEEGVQRVIVIESSVNEALDERVSSMRFGHNGQAGELNFSDLVTAMVEHYLEHASSNGAGS